MPHGRADAAPVALVATTTDATDALECALTAFDVEDDLASIIPMPETIPALIRANITRAIAQRFTFADQLDEWLHSPHGALAGDTPFQRVVDGDGIRVLIALVQGSGDTKMEARIADLERTFPRIRLLR